MAARGIACFIVLLAGGCGGTRPAISVDDNLLVHCPSMFVVVFSARSNFQQRRKVRSMWVDFKHSVGEGVQWKFAVCDAPPDDEGPRVSKAIAFESKLFGDILEMNCTEGYKEGLLTKKVERAMRAYLTAKETPLLFMKTDDDTFVDFRRLCDFLVQRATNINHIYAGVFIEGDEANGTVGKVVRDPESDFYEPTSTYHGDVYPSTAQGGPGYLISRSLISEIFDAKVPEKHTLYNEDRAVAVWVDELIKRGTQVEFVDIPGTNGYTWHTNLTVTGPWKGYPYILHHHLQGNTIACLQHLAMAGDLENPIDACFSHERRAAHTILVDVTLGLILLGVVAFSAYICRGGFDKG